MDLEIGLALGREIELSVALPDLDLQMVPLRSQSHLHCGFRVEG